MNNTFLLLTLLVFSIVGLATTGCSPQSESGSVAEPPQTVQGAYSMPEKGNFRLNLTDKPHQSLSNVFVTIDHVELLINNRHGEKGRLIIGQNIGTIDLLKLRDGVLLPVKDLDLQHDVRIDHFRLVLKDSPHWLVRKSDGSTCEMKTPSEQKTGIKVSIPHGGIVVKPNTNYSMVIDFDVDHSVVDNRESHKSLNHCLLKPVLKLKCLHTSTNGSDPQEDGTVTEPDPATGGSDGTATGGGTPTTGGGTTTGGTDPTTGGNADTTSGGTIISGDNTTATTDPNDEAPIVLDGDTCFFNVQP